MRMLLLGGGVFLGRALTDAALAAGHDVTHVNRGQSAAPDPRVRHLRADRAEPAALARVLGGGSWDAVMDTSGYMPRVVGLATAALRERAPRYLFVSSISVYRGPGCDEAAPLAAPPEPMPEAMTPQTYGALKAMCESVVAEAFGEGALIVRPGLIAGPHDPTDRFTYWPVRLARGCEVLAPGRASRSVQFIDVRDLAEWMVRLVERGKGGTWNATGPARRLAMGDLLDACRAVAANDARIEWVDEAFLAAQGVAPWKDLPLWIPEADALASGFMDVPIGRALADGLALRPLTATIAETLAWANTLPADREWKAGLEAGRERALLSAHASARTCSG